MSTPSVIGKIPASGSAGIRKPQQDSRWNNTGLSLPGGDAAIFKEKTHNDVMTFRSLKEGTGITLTEGANYITIDGASTTTATSLGGDADVYKENSSGELRFRGITGGTGITVTEGATEITIDSSSTTTAISLGGDADVYKEESGGELRFRGLTGGAGITLTENLTDITIDSDLTLPGSSTDEALVRWDSTGGTSILNSVVTLSDAGLMTFPTGGSIITRTINSDNAFVAVTIEDCTFLNGYATVGDARATNSVIINETTPSSYQTGAGNLYTNTSGDLCIKSDKFYNDELVMTPWTTKGQIQYCNRDPVTDGGFNSVTTDVLDLGSEGQVLTANATSDFPEWRYPNIKTTEVITAVADDSTINAVSLTVEQSYIDVTSDGGAGTLAKLTLADGTSLGTTKNIFCRTIANAGVDTAELKVTSLIDASGTTGTKSFSFTSAGQSIYLAWNGTYWHIADTGTSIIASTF